MGRGLPWSVLLHVAVITLTIMFGSRVQRPVIRPPRSIDVRIVRPQPPRPEPAAAREEPAPTPEPEPAETEPVLPPKEVPDPPRREQPEPEPERSEPEPAPEAPPAEESDEPAAESAETSTPLLSGPAVAGTDTDFPFAWYLSQIEARIARNWRPRQLGFANRRQVSCAVHFVITRGGAVTQVTLVRNSGVGVYDREALRAVRSARLMPLPPQYPGSSLGVTFNFTLEPRS